MMWKKNQTIRVLAKGGILTPAHLSRILEIVKLAGSSKVHFGSRQDLLFEVKTGKMPEVEAEFIKMKCDYIIYGNKEIRAQNIVSSYVSADIMNATSWLSSGNYLYVLENFKYQPTLCVNIADPAQSLVPLMFGQLNFIASPIQHYWYLYIRRTNKDLPVRWPVMVLSDDIGVVSQAFEQSWAEMQKGNVSDWFLFFQKRVSYNSRKIEIVPELDFKYSQDYEGFGRMSSSQNYWAGFYWRNNAYEIDFLEELCSLCSKTGISKICITPWKSFLVKEILPKDLVLWDMLLGKFGINMRHSSFDMNWHLPFNNKLALGLKRNIVKRFDKVDVCVYGLTFGVKEKNAFPFYSIQIEKNSGINIFNKFNLFSNFKISYAKDFNPNLGQYIIFNDNVPGYQVAEVLKSLSLKFYSQYLHSKDDKLSKIELPKKIQTTVYQCDNCQTIYNESKGLTIYSIPAGTRFEKIPDNFKCPLCDAPKSDFSAVFLEELLKNSLV